MPENIYSVLKPMFYSTKLIGLSPFSLNAYSYDANYVLNLIWSICLSLSLGGISFFSLNTREDIDAPITKVTDFLHTRLSVSTLCIVILFSCIFRADIVEIVREVSQVDKELIALYSNFVIQDKHKKFKLYSTITAFILWFYIASLFVLDISAFTTLDLVSIGQVFAYAGPMLTVFVELQFCTLILVLKQRFALLNNKMATLKYNDHNFKYKRKTQFNSSKIDQIAKNKIFMAMQQISLQHHRLCTISNKVNKAYSFQILLIIVQAFLSIIVVSFYTARLLFSGNSNLLSLKQRFYYVNMLILYTSMIIVLVVICSNTTKEARKTGIVFHKMMSWKIFIDSERLDLGIVCFSTQLLHHNVKLTACKLFVIDETLLYNIVGSATIYLVIALQFELGINSSEK